MEPSCEPDEEAAPGGSEVRHERRRSLDDDDINDNCDNKDDGVDSDDDVDNVGMKV